MLVFAGEHGEFDVVPYCWLPGESLLEAQDRDRMPYGVWAHQGHLLTFPGRTTDPKAVALKIAELHGRYQYPGAAYDRWRIEDLKRELDAIGCSVSLVPFGQGFKDLSPAVDVLERLVEEGKLRHGNHPVLAWPLPTPRSSSTPLGIGSSASGAASAASIRSLLCVWHLVLQRARRRRSILRA